MSKLLLHSISGAFYSCCLLSMVACAPIKGSFDEISSETIATATGTDQETPNYSRYDVNLHPLHKTVCDPFGGGGVVNPEKGIMAMLFYVGAGGSQLQSALDFPTQATRSRQQLFFSDMNVPTRMFSEGFATQTSNVVLDDSGQKLIEWFGLQFQTSLRLSPEMPEGDYELGTLSDDGVVLKAKINGTWTTLIDNDGVHPTRMGCSSNLIHFSKDTLLPIEVSYYQGPRYHIANVLMWKLSDSTIVGKDAECGKKGNTYFFDPNHGGAALQPYQNLLARGWQPIAANSFFIPMESSYNPCVESATVPVISNFRVMENFSQEASVAWTTDIPATTQVLITNVSTGQQTMTSADNVLRTSHQVRVTNLMPGTPYRLQAISISDSLGKGLSAELTITTLE